MQIQQLLLPQAVRKGFQHDSVSFRARVDAVAERVINWHGVQGLHVDPFARITTYVAAT
jgi:hypothetical protein